MFRIKTITPPQGNRSFVTIEETDAALKPTGREWLEPFDVQKKDWAELKARFIKRIAASDAVCAEITTLTIEANDAKITTFP